jgi:DNA 3'-phosphatase
MSHSIEWCEKKGVSFTIPKSYQFKLSVAIFGFKDVLMKQVEQKESTSDVSYEWDIASTNVIPRLQEINSKGASICIISNQTDESVVDIKTAYARLCELAKVPILVMLSTRLNSYRKPFTGMWNLLNFIYNERTKQTVRTDKSIMVGAAYGKGNKNTIKDYDFAFATNVGITFVSPEVFFDRKVPKPYKFGETVMSPQHRTQLLGRYINTKNTIIEQIQTGLASLPKCTSFVIMLIGPPSSGKTTLAKLLSDLITKHLKYKIVTIDKVGKDCYVEMRNHLSEDTSVILDRAGTELYNERGKILGICKKAQVNTIIIDINMQTSVAMLLNYIKVQTSTDSDEEVKPSSCYKMYVKRYQAPVYTEPNIHVIRYDMPIYDLGPNGLLRYSALK